LKEDLLGSLNDIYGLRLLEIVRDEEFLFKGRVRTIRDDFSGVMSHEISSKKIFLG